jgi:hypothetical protein
MSGLTFDEASHTYAFDGVPVPGVTAILQPLTDFSFVKAEVMSAAQAFGTAVHLACELWDRGTLDEGELDPALAPYLAGWRLFSAEHDVKWRRIEEKVYHPIYRYAGTLDREGLVDGKAAVADIKSSVDLYPAVGPQLAAYKNATPGASPLMKRYAVQLKDDGTYVLKEYADRDDWPMFLSLLTLRLWCQRHSIVPKF